MGNLRLAYTEKGQEVLYDLGEADVTIGRSAKADVVINDYGVSRLHAKIMREEGGYAIQDLDSRNGTKVNDVRITHAPIAKGDRITLGNFALKLAGAEPEAADLVVVDAGEDKDISPESGTIIRSAEELDKLLEAASEKEGAPIAEADIERSNKILRTLTQVAKVLISADRLDEMLEKVMNLVFEHLPAERGVLGLYEGETLVPRVVRYRKAGTGDEKITLPRAITNKVRLAKVSILTMDAMKDDRFHDSQSIFMLGIRSAMCVPLWQGDHVIGIIYVDEDVQAGTFNTNDLDLLAALGNYAAVAIERTRLTEKVQEEQAARSKLERYHSPGVVELIIRGGRGSEDTMQTTNKVVSVSFTDLVGFTTISEALSARELGDRLNRFFTEMTECIFKYEGTLDKYIGDCIMAVFGAPLDQEDHAIRCLRAALEMHRTVETLSLAEAGDGPRFNIRTGINSGSVVAGDIGSPKRKDYSVLGDTVNIASRLESSIAAPGQIVVGEPTYLLVKDYFEVEPLGSHSLKGKKLHMNAYRVLGEKPGVFT